MSHEPNAFHLACTRPGGPEPVMSQAQVSARLDGLLYELTLRQTYQNIGTEVLEVVYTFPLPAQAVLLGFASELNGRRLEGAITPRPQGAQGYEEALALGDAPVMLEVAPGSGLHTANIGNLKPGETLVLEVRFAQLLQFEQGRLRLVLPTTIAPRYGDPLAAGLQPQQVPQASLGVEYPLTFDLSVSGAWAEARFESPSHALRQWREGRTLRLALDSQAWLDRDLVIIATPGSAQPAAALLAADRHDEAAAVVALASLVPPPAPARPHVTLKLLVDCSGSMAGDGMASARRALAGLADSLRPGDRVSLSRFGSDLEHQLPPALCTPAHLQRLRQDAAAMEADMGGTEMDAALRNTFALADPDQPEDDQADVLLITDGQYWQSDRVLAAARASGHRVFVIGVGNAPAERELRALATATGGASEFATPGEALEAAARRSFQRIRQQAWRDLQVDWGVTPVWQLPLPSTLFEGDTVLALAGLPGTAPVQPVRVTALNSAGTRQTLGELIAEAADGAQALPRLAASRRLPHESPARQAELALRYQLLTPDTCCVLVHERSDAERAQGAAELHRMQSMLAAGWGGTGQAAPRTACELSALMVCDFDALAAPSAPASGALPAMMAIAPAAGAPAMRRAAPRQKATLPPPQPDATLGELMAAVADHFRRHQPLTALAQALSAWQAPAEVRQALGRLYRLGVDFDAAWVLLAQWHAQRHGGAEGAERLALLRGALRLVEPALQAQAMAALDAPPAFDTPEPSPAGNPRQSRLQQAMARLRR